ncbi:MAG TPA: hypothetical protein VNA20_05480 [Frankiaceae bacterium]|nr:hypothetical protein [Frankiaceae bacterium]
MKRAHAALLAAVVVTTSAVVVAVAPIAISSDSDPKADLVEAIVDPAASLPDAEREAAYLQQLQSHAAARDEWVTEFEDSARSVTGMQTAELHVASLPPKTTLANAVASAEVVVRAVVEDLTFTPQTTIATLRVEDVVKGPAALPAALRISIGGGPEPDKTYTTGVLGIDPSMPFLYEGMAALLFLEAEPAASPMPVEYVVQAFTGTYLVDAGGAIHPHEGNPFGASVDGLSVKAFTDLIQRAR